MNININLKNNYFQSKNDKDFCDRIYSKGLEIYINRLKQYKFQNLEKVLDAGCGFGQWSLGLSQLNKNVYACDVVENRIDFLNKVAIQNNIINIHTKQTEIYNLPYDNSFFDAIFCYSVIFVTPWKKSLAELIRVLKSGGKIYINANSLGWYKHLWYKDHNKTSDYDPKLIAAEAWSNTYRYNNNLDINFPCNLIIEPEELISEAKSLGISDIMWDGEGLINNDGSENAKPFFQKEYMGDIGVYEIIGTKK